MLERRDRQRWWIAVRVILGLTAALILTHLPEFVGQSDDFVTRNRTYLTGLLLLVPLYCLYVLQSTALSRKLRKQLIENQTKDDFVASVAH